MSDDRWPECGECRERGYVVDDDGQTMRCNTCVENGRFGVTLRGATVFRLAPWPGSGICYHCRRHCDPNRSSCDDCNAELYFPPEIYDEDLP